MKFLYIVSLCFLCSITILKSQQKKEKSATGGDCEPYQYAGPPPGVVTRQGTLPYEEEGMKRELNNFLNAKNWEVYTNTSTSATFSTFASPFFSPDNVNVRHLNRGSVNTEVPWIFYYEQGWRLIKKNIGTPTTPVPNPYFVFYNAYTGKYRVFLLLTQIYSNLTNVDPLSANNATLTFKMRNSSQNYTPNFFGEISNPSPTVIEKDNIKEISFPQKVLSLVPYWLFAEFSTSYDPCACRDNTDLQQPFIDFSLFIDTGSNVNLCSYNDPQQQCNEILNPSGVGANQTKNAGLGSEIASTASTVEKTVKEAYNVSKDVKSGFGDFIPAYEKAFLPTFNGQAFDFNNINYYSSFPFPFSGKFISYMKKYDKHKKNVASLKKVLDGVGKVVEVLGTISAGVSTLYSIVKMFTGTEEEGGTKSFISYVTQGTIKGRSENFNGAFPLSGTKQYTEKTIYPNLGGVLSVLEPPKVKYSRVQPIRSINIGRLGDLYSSLLLPTANAQRNSNLWGYNFFMFDEVPKVIINPALNVDLEKSEISVSYEFEGIDNIPHRFDKDLTTTFAFSAQRLYGTGEMYAKNMINDNYVGNYQLVILGGSLFGNFKTLTLPTPMYHTPYYPLGCTYQNRYQNAVYFRTMPSSTQENLPKVYVKVVAKLQPRNSNGVEMDKILYVNRYNVNLVEDKSLNNDDWLKYFKYRTDNMSLEQENVHIDYEGWEATDIYAKQTIDISINPSFSAALPNKKFFAGMSVEILPNGNPELQINSEIEIIPALNQDNTYSNCEIPASSSNPIVTCSQGLYNVSHYYNKPVKEEQAAESRDNVIRSELSIYPNPANQQVTFSYMYEDENDNTSTIYVTDMTGVKIFDFSNQINREKNKIEVLADVSQWKSGVYLVVLETKNQKIVKRLMVTK